MSYDRLAFSSESEWGRMNLKSERIVGRALRFEILPSIFLSVGGRTPAEMMVDVLYL